ncbi:MAG: winged helix-turn-helix domain-containing protein [Rhodococcus sp. (in: high G+C Gram-positive bacteria)]
MTEQFEARLAALEERVAALENIGDTAEDVGRTPTGGSVGYEGDVHLNGHVSWTIGYLPDAVLELSVPRTSDVLAALGHPVRLHIVRLLLRGPANAAAILDAVGHGGISGGNDEDRGRGSTGQVYHHLKVLGSAGVVEQHGRGDYRIGAKKVVPLLVAMLAAADISGELGT